MLPAIAFAVWLVALSLQLADIGTARFDARLLARGTRTVVRLHPVAWVVPLAALVVVGLGVGVEWAGRLFFDDREPAVAALVAVALVTVVVGAWLAITAAATRPATDSYRAVRDELVDLAGTRAQQERLDEMRGRIAALDDDRGRTPPPLAVSVRSTARWVVARPQRLLPPAAGVLLLVFVAIAAVERPGHEWLVIGAAFAVALSTVLSLAGARASVALLAAVRDTQLKYRAEAEYLLTEAEKTSRKPVAGLGDRVARALQILREQQG